MTHLYNTESLLPFLVIRCAWLCSKALDLILATCMSNLEWVRHGYYMWVVVAEIILLGVFCKSFKKDAGISISGLQQSVNIVFSRRLTLNANIHPI